MATRSTKRPTGKPAEATMRFFTPELYCQFNSADDLVADSADEAWEKAIRDYHRHLDGVRDKLPSQVRTMTESCLHDAEVLELTQEGPIESAIAAVLLKQEGEIINLVYFLWDNVRESRKPRKWPVSPSKTRSWLYDEFDVAPNRNDLFLHRVLFSDGRVVEIPFRYALSQRFSLPVSEKRSRRIA